MLRIAEARRLRGWSQERLANAIGTTQQTLQRWESGVTDPQVSKVQQISAALGVTVSYLLGMDEAAAGSDAMSVEERELLALYRAATPELRSAAIAVLRSRQAVEAGKVIA